MPDLKSLFSLKYLVMGIAGMILLSLSPSAFGESRFNKATAGAEHTSEIPVKTTAESMDFDQKNGMIVAHGHVVVTHGTTKLFADQAQVNTQTKQAHAEGHVRLQKGEKEWMMDAVDYNFDTGAMVAGESHGQLEHGIFFQSKSLESEDKDEYILKNSFLTTSDYEHPGYRLQAGTILVYPHNRAVFHDLVLYLGKIPVFYFPYLVYPLDDSADEGLNTGTQVQTGRKGRWGLFVLNSYTTRLSDEVRPTYRLDYRQQQGVAGGVDVRYKAGERKDTDKGQEFEPNVKGKISAYYADDQKAAETGETAVVTSTSDTQQVIPRERYQIRVSQRAELTDEVYTKLKVDKLSDPNLLMDFFEKEYQTDPQPDNFAELTKWSPNTTLSILARPSVNNFYTTTERLPEVDYDFKRQSLWGSPIFYEGENSAAYLSKDFASTDGSNNYHTTRYDSFHQILYPKQYFGWLNFTPNVGGRATYYDESLVNANQPNAMRTVFNTGFEAGFKASRTWKDVQDKQWEIDGLRHIVEPSISYGFVARPNYGPSELEQFDVEHSSFGVDENLPPITFPQYTGVDSIDSSNVFRPGIRQRLQTRRDGTSWDLADLNIYKDIFVDKKDGENAFSDVFTEFEAKPVRWLTLDWRSRYDYQNDQIRESSTGLTVYKAKVWQVRVSHDYFRDVGDQMALQWSWAMSEDWAVRTLQRFDPRTGSLSEQSYALDRDLHSWIASVSVDELRPQNLAPDWRFWISFTLKAFPEMEFDSRQIGGNH